MIAEGGEMVEPLRDPAWFARVFLDDGILTWPNGFDLDSIALHTEMKERGLLRRCGARRLDSLPAPRKAATARGKRWSPERCWDPIDYLHRPRRPHVLPVRIVRIA